MKQVFLFVFVAAALFACNSSDTKTADDSKMGDTKVAAMSTSDFAYPIKEWPDWQPGSMDHLKMVLQSLKNYETGDVDACMNAFADSIELRFEGLTGKFSKDSVTKMFKAGRANSKAYEINMEDYESVKSKDGKQEYVSMWYKEKWQDQQGKWDSAICMDDLKIVNGRIASIDQKTRHFTKKKM
jgi:hypothetical protein